MKKFIICVLSLFFLMGSIAIAEDNKTEKNPTGTIVGIASGLLNNQFVYVDPTKAPKEQPPVVKKLLKQGVFTAAEDAQQGQVVVSPKTSN